ncbi:MAG: hypothetical protein ACKOPH_10495, partial [Methylocystis sp.]
LPRVGFVESLLTSAERKFDKNLYSKIIIATTISKNAIAANSRYGLKNCNRPRNKSIPDVTP